MREKESLFSESKLNPPPIIIKIPESRGLAVCRRRLLKSEVSMAYVTDFKLS